MYLLICVCPAIVLPTAVKKHFVSYKLVLTVFFPLTSMKGGPSEGAASH